MVLQILTTTNSQFTINLPVEMISKEIEIIAFEVLNNSNIKTTFSEELFNFKKKN